MNEESEDVGRADDDDFSPPPPLQDIPAPYFRGFGESLASTAQVEFNSAMLAVQSELDVLLIADKANPFTKSRFASLGQLLANVKPVLNKHGFLLRQFCGTVRTHGNMAKRWYSNPIITLVTHVKSGQWEAIVQDLPVETTTYSYGSAMTFGKRYGLQSYLGLATVDDDGAATIQNRIDEAHTNKVVEAAVEEIRRCKDVSALTRWLEENRDGLNNLSEGAALTTIRTAYSERRKALEAQHDAEHTEGAGKPKRKAKGEAEPGSGLSA